MERLFIVNFENIHTNFNSKLFNLALETLLIYNLNKWLLDNGFYNIALEKYIHVNNVNDIVLYEDLSKFEIDEILVENSWVVDFLYQELKDFFISAKDIYYTLFTFNKYIYIYCFCTRNNCIISLQGYNQ